MVLGGSWVVAKQAVAVPRWEERTFRRVNGLPAAVWPLAWAPMQLGNVVGSLGVVALTSVVTADRRLARAAFGASQVAWWSGKVIKVLVSRPRPAVLLGGVHLREEARGRGYVSGHAAVAFALASVMAPSMPRRWAPAPFVAATAVAFGRVYAGVHLPVDVIGEPVSVWCRAPRCAG